MDKKKKLKFLAICFLIVFPIYLLLPKTTVEIENAVVNEENGDIAMTYYDDKSHGIVLILFDKEGSMLWEKYFNSAGGSHSSMLFSEDSLHIYIGRTNEQYAYTRDGEEITSTVDSKELKARQAWDNWDSSYGKKEFVFDQYRYTYTWIAWPKSLFDEKCTLTVQKEGEQSIVLIEKESADGGVSARIPKNQKTTNNQNILTGCYISS